MIKIKNSAISFLVAAKIFSTKIAHFYLKKYWLNNAIPL